MIDVKDVCMVASTARVAVDEALLAYCETCIHDIRQTCRCDRCAVAEVQTAARRMFDGWIFDRFLAGGARNE